MCINCRYIYNHFSRRKVLVPCGKCKACQQEKALKRTNRIRNNSSFGNIALFITLTYKNDFVPYIRKSDLSSSSLDVPVYRDAHCRYIFSPRKGLNLSTNYGTEEIMSVYIPTEFRSDSDVLSLRTLSNGSSDKVGVCLNIDFQNFIKRLKINLQRKYNYATKFSYFYCSEYGAISKRPHFHALLFIPANDENIFRNAIVENWPFADRYRTEKYVEVARDAASYVSSYVNGNISLPSCLQISLFKSKHNYSRNFGTFLDCFSLGQILYKIDAGDLSYNIAKTVNGTDTFVSVPVPLYVLNRYFPKFKGFGWLSSSQLRSILLSPQRIDSVLSEIENPLYQYSPKETYRIFVRLSNAIDYFKKTTSLSEFDYADYYIRCYNVHASNVIRHSYDNILTFNDFKDFYENALNVVSGEISAPTLSSIEYFCVNPNARRDVVERTYTFTDLYERMDKQRKVTNYVLSKFHNF